MKQKFLAISAADGYTRKTGRAQCVLVHVDVGTAALGQGLHNASSGKVPMIIIAGEAPTTLSGVPGCRSEPVQWYQNVHGQGDLVRPYSRYTYSLSVHDDIRRVIFRAKLMATTGVPGPVYLTASREVLAAQTSRPGYTRHKSTMSHGVGELSNDYAKQLAQTLIKAKSPLVVTGYLGRDQDAVMQLQRLTKLVPSLRVLDSEARYMSFPASDPAWISPRTGARSVIASADLILILDCDVPWIPSKICPAHTATIWHLDFDTRKDFMQQFDFGAGLTLQVKCKFALKSICNILDSQSRQDIVQTEHVSSRENRQRDHAKGLEILHDLALKKNDDTIHADLLFAALRTSLPRDTIFVADAVTNQGRLMEQLQLKTPGTFFTKGGSGLGWAMGASIGMKLALRSRESSMSETSQATFSEIDDPLICCVIGDGAYMFSSPAVAFLDAAGHQTPLLTVVINNGGWHATRMCVDDVHPGGAAANNQNGLYKNHLRTVRPDYVGIAKAASGNSMWGLRVEHGQELTSALQDAVHKVTREKVGAILDVVIS
jgi:thiamine pyrophosphate-dependent acetolactate synthase large subunit-like protein